MTEEEPEVIRATVNSEEDEEANVIAMELNVENVYNIWSTLDQNIEGAEQMLAASYTMAAIVDMIGDVISEGGDPKLIMGSVMEALVAHLICAIGKDVTDEQLHSVLGQFSPGQKEVILRIVETVQKQFTVDRAEEPNQE